MEERVKFVFFTDPHVADKWPASRIDNYKAAILEKIMWVINLANSIDAYIIVGGDWVHRFNGRPSVVNSIMEILRFANKDIFGIIGNHDIYGHNYEVIKDVFTGSLFASGLVTLLTSNPLILKDSGISIQLTGTNYRPDIDKDKTSYNVKKLASADRAIHVTHSFLLATPWPSISEDKFTMIDNVNTEADVVCIGHDHKGFGIQERNGVIFTNPGSLGRISSDLAELKRMPKASVLTVYKDRCEVSLVSVPALPGTKVFDRDILETEIERKRNLKSFKTALDMDLSDIALVSNIDDIFNESAVKDNISKEVLETSKLAIKTYEESSIK